MEVKAEKRRLEEEEKEKTRPRRIKKKLVPRKDYYAVSLLVEFKDSLSRTCQFTMVSCMAGFL